MTAEQVFGRKYRARIEYLGTGYSGWQMQKNRPTIQGTLTQVLSRLAQDPITVVGASRTDAGVHARGQVCHFSFPDRPTIPDLAKAVNANLPWDIRMMTLNPASSTFHAQRSAQKKRYDYVIWTGNPLPPFLYGRICHVRGSLDLRKMEKAAKVLGGRHDFRGFAAASISVKTTTRTLFRSELHQNGRKIRYRVEADGLLHHMVRNMVGTLIEIGRGRMAPEAVSEVLASKSRSKAGPTAPACGLCLKKIWYPPEEGI